MVDFIKILLAGYDRKFLFSHPLLDFKSIYDEKSKKKSFYKKAVYKNLEFIYKGDNYFLLQGSLHKFFNDGKQNYNDFSFADLQCVLEDLVELFKIDLSECIILNIEFGVNIIPPINTQLILDFLIQHWNKKFKDMALSDSEGYYRLVKHQRCHIKAYDKFLHYRKDYNIENEILRFELHFKKMIHLNMLGIKRLSDLQNRELFNQMLTLLLEEWDKVLMYDCTIIENDLDARTRGVKLNQWQNALYWQSLTKQARNRQIKQYKKVCLKHSQHTHQNIKLLINDKWLELMAKIIK